MAIPVTLFDFAAEVVGKPGPIVVDVDIYTDDGAVEDVVITGKSCAPATLPITLQDIRKAFTDLNVRLIDELSDCITAYTFDSIRFDEERNKYVIVWND